MDLDRMKTKFVIDGCCKVCSEINIPKEIMMEYENKECGKYSKCGHKDEMLKILSEKIKSIKNIQDVTEFKCSKCDKKYASKLGLELSHEINP